MFTERAKTSLETLLEISLESSVGDVTECRSVADKESISKERVIVLTMSSYTFRVLVLLFYTEDNSLKSYIAEKTKLSVANLDETKISDYMQEIGNAVCGAMKRELGMCVPHLGMSTPYILELSSLNYLERLKFDYAVYKKVSFSSGLELFGGIAASAEGEVDILITKSAASEDDVDLGELELF